MSPPTILLPARESAEIPAHALVARFGHLLDSGWDARMVCDNDPEWWRAIIPAELRSRVEFGPAAGGRPPDVVHYTTGAIALAALAAERRQRSKVVVTMGGDDLCAAGLGTSGHYDPVWRTADVLHLPDTDLAERARDRGCPDHLARETIPPGVGDTGFAAPPDREATGELRLLSAGPLDWTRGHEHALHAVRLLIDRGIDCRYRVVGAGAYAGAVAFARYQLGLEPAVELLDAVDTGGLRDQLRWADVFVDASVVEGSPAALLEAQAAGLPAVVTDAGRRAAALDGSVLMAPRRDPAAMADRLAVLAADAGLRRRLGERGRERARGFPLQAQLEAFEGLYRSLL